MLLFALLHNKILKPERGDVIIFNNTSAEHPQTYDFIRRCQQASESFGIPFFWIQYQTYEDARKSGWTRIHSYRLVNNRPYHEETNPDGFRWKGETFEELLSWTGYVPNQFSRTCTKEMKLETTRSFLTDWLAGNESIPRLGHFGEESRIKPDDLHKRHKKNGGSVPKSVLIQKRSYALNQDHARPEQHYADFSSAWKPVCNANFTEPAHGNQAVFGKDGIEYVSLIGLRGDEPERIQRIQARDNTDTKVSYAGEHVYTPLADMHISKEDVDKFWAAQGSKRLDRGLAKDGILSNCVFCFLKGTRTLEKVQKATSKINQKPRRGYGPLISTPSDVNWWKTMESNYQRDLIKEKRKKKRDSGPMHIGFFGTSGMSYEKLASNQPEAVQAFADKHLPCDCTD